MTNHFVRASLATLAMFLCMLVAGAVVAFVPIWPGLSGRDFRVSGAIMAALICAVAIVLYGRLRWPAIDLLASLLGAETIALYVIAFFSGLTGFQLFDRFNLWWFGTISLFIVPPWLIGLLIGSFMRKHHS
jgi:hypothetical protein